MKKLLILIPAVFLLASCGGVDKKTCVDNCIKALSAICEANQAENCADICDKDDAVYNCVISAENCDDINEKMTTCFSKSKTEENIAEDNNKPEEATCESVCQKYSDCAAFTEDATEQDLRDAYDSCMTECPLWSPEGLACMNSKEIKEPMDCMALSLCGAAEYQDRF